MPRSLSLAFSLIFFAAVSTAAQSQDASPPPPAAPAQDSAPPETKKPKKVWTNEDIPRSTGAVLNTLHRFESSSTSCRDRSPISTSSWLI